MRKIVSIICILSALSLVAWADSTDHQKPSYRAPFFEARKHQTKYAGPGRDEHPPASIKQVLIGYFGPSTPTHPQAGDMWRAAGMAVEQANQQGGYAGIPFRLVPAWSENPWGSGVSQLTRLIYIHKLWAIIGGIDGPSTHLAEQVAAKARITVLNPVSTDKTVNLANVPWIFSLAPQDHLLAPVLADAIASNVDAKPFVLASAVDHDSRVFTVELTKSLAQHRLVLSYHFEFKPQQRQFEEFAEGIVCTQAPTLVLIAGPHDSARLISTLRQKHFAGLIFGGPCMGQRYFLQEATKAAENTLFPLLYAPSGISAGFEERFNSCFGHRPDYFAAHTYDAARLLITAIHNAGLNRVRVRDAISELSPWTGVTGDITWDALGANRRTVCLGTVKSGRVISASEPPALDESMPRCSPR
jgi:branched-chain amino acid transport system substrate-binding protein